MIERTNDVNTFARIRGVLCSRTYEQVEHPEDAI